MYILILEDVPGSLADATKLLVDASHEVRVVAEVAAATHELSVRLPDIMLVAAPPEAVSSFARVLQPMDYGIYRALIAVVPDESIAVSEIAFQAGADDVVVRTARPHEFRDHVRAAERVVKLERRLRERVAELESAMRRLGMNAVSRGQDVVSGADLASTRGGLQVLLTTTWTGLDDLLMKMCTEYLNVPFANLVGATLPTTAEGWHGSRVALADVENELKLELSFWMAPESARIAAIGFCGGDDSMVDDAVINDVGLELANSGMGVLKAGFLGEEFRFAAAIPENVSSHKPEKQLEGALAKRVFAFRSDNAAVVYAVVTLRSQGRVKMRATLLREGMVLAADVLTDAGVLLIRSGTRLTEMSAEKLGRMFPKREIELAE